MAATITLTGDWLTSLGNRRLVHGTGNLGASYTTGGEVVTPGNVGLGVLDSLHIAPAGGYVFEWDAAAGKVKAFYADYDAVADGALIEVAAAVNLSAVTFKFTAIGY